MAWFRKVPTSAQQIESQFEHDLESQQEHYLESKLSEDEVAIVQSKGYLFLNKKCVLSLRAWLGADSKVILYS